MRNLETKLKKVESIIEHQVIRYLADAGYEAIPQFSVGAYRIDIVFSGGKRLAVECDGEQFRRPGHPQLLYETARDETATVNEQIAKLEAEIDARVATLYCL